MDNAVLKLTAGSWQLAACRTTSYKLQATSYKLNKKAQIDFSFIISVVLLSVMVVSVTLFVMRMTPNVKNDAHAITIEGRAVDLSKLLIDDPGNPANWSTQPSTGNFRVGFALYDNNSNKVVTATLDETKIKYANSSLNYSFVKNSTGVESDVDFRLIIRNTTAVLLDLYNNASSQPSTSRVVALKRFAALNNTYVNITLLVW